MTASSLEATLARISADEMVAAIGLARAPRWARRGASLPFLALSARLARALARFESDTERFGLPPAARRMMSAFGASLAVRGGVPRDGALLVIANHPGAYDTLALFAAMGRRDVLTIADDRDLWRVLPHVGESLLLARSDASARAAIGRRAIGHLRRGGALLHFAAGAIEPDAAFVSSGASVLGRWQSGTGMLVRAAERAHGHVALAAVRGVHSVRAKRLAVTRLAEARGVTTLAPLLQIAFDWPDVAVRVDLVPADAGALVKLGDDHAITDALLAEMQRRLVAPWEPAQEQSRD